MTSLVNKETCGNFYEISIFLKHWIVRIRLKCAYLQWTKKTSLKHCYLNAWNCNMSFRFGPWKRGLFWTCFSFRFGFGHISVSIFSVSLKCAKSHKHVEPSWVLTGKFVQCAFSQRHCHCLAFYHTLKNSQGLHRHVRCRCIVPER